MKMIFAIVHNDDAALVSSELTKGGFHVTKLASTGGFLMAGNTTFITGVDDADVDNVIDIIAKYSKRRMQSVDSAAAPSGASGAVIKTPIQIQMGGATIFVMNIDRFEQV